MPRKTTGTMTQIKTAARTNKASGANMVLEVLKIKAEAKIKVVVTTKEAISARERETKPRALPTSTRVQATKTRVLQAHKMLRAINRIKHIRQTRATRRILPRITKIKVPINPSRD